MTDLKVGDLVAMNRITGVWSGKSEDPKWVDWPQEPMFAVVKSVTKDPNHTGDPACTVQVACKGLSGEVGHSMTSWEDPRHLRVVMKYEALKVVLEGLPNEPHEEVT